MTAPSIARLLRTVQRGPRREIQVLYISEYQLAKTSNTLRATTSTALAHRSNHFA